MRRVVLAILIAGCLSASSGSARADTTGTIVNGSVPPDGGFGLIVWGGGRFDQLVAAIHCTGSPVFWSTDAGGNFIVFLPTSTIAVVNAGFSALYPNGTVPANTPLLGRCVQPVTTKTVTLADQGATVYMQVNDTFLLMLGEGFRWDVQVADQSILSRVPNVLVVRGAQGIYRAHQPGQTTLTAIGSAACLPSTPPCAQPSLVFTITVIVQ